ncbi:oxidoreductase [Xylona heveae TC161]|uniref:Oxidoreductase n=1 Tax=Xylona heveae (strain CBS 132557 / TC161) TaxID=1328760 RepID=A0A165HQ38_XYLHT|nr:oxidoreductase [Xylona heveae TC161]KZF23822.1 oxidoreductase [Xylona heveae TC161]
MAFYMTESMPWHEGENQMHKLMHVPDQDNPSSPFLSPGAGYMTQRSPLVALGTLDAKKRPWTTILGGEAGFARPIGSSIIGISTLVDKKDDPVIESLLKGRDDGEVVQPGKDGIMIGGLAIDLEHRMRVKLYGKMIAGSLQAFEEHGARETNAIGQLQLAVRIDESLGNCPKYLNKKQIQPATPTPKLISDSPQLSPQAISLLSKADLFFISSSHGSHDMDTNHRGGPPGFVRVLSNDPSGAVIVYPEYSGNRLYQTLGNLQTTPLAGLAIPDFDTGDAIYLTGRTEVLIGHDAAAILPRSNLAVKVTITSSRFVQNGLSFRGIVGEPSPYNPNVRFATTEKHTAGTELGSEGGATQQPSTYATLINSERLTPTISRFRFKIQDPSAVHAPWKPGQYAALSFADDLDIGYSHMRDDDPRSLNDDYMRTFTISSPPSLGRNKSSKAPGPARTTRSAATGPLPPVLPQDDTEFELTIRRVGRVTSYLFDQAARAKRTKTEYKIPLKGFGGDFSFATSYDSVPHSPDSPYSPNSHSQSVSHAIIPFIAGGIGITPLLGQLPFIDSRRLRLLWSISIKDIGLVADTFRRYPELLVHPGVVQLFLTGKAETDIETKEDRKSLQQVMQSGVKVELRRLEKRDVDELSAADAEKGGEEEEEVNEWYMCVGPRLKSAVLNWLAGERIIYEDFGY